MNNIKRDAIFSIICGELTAAFLLLVIKNPYVAEFESLSRIGNLSWFLLILFPIFFFIGILAGRLLSKIIPVIFQIIKFGEVGALNTFVDAGILNFLIALTGITSGFGLVPMNTFAFLCAVTNSYFWNKFWTFKTEEQAPSTGSGQAGKTFMQFLVVSVIGWGINTGILVIITTYMNPVLGLSAGAWVNVAKVIAIFFSMVWNFIGYKFFVFKNK